MFFLKTVNRLFFLLWLLGASSSGLEQAVVDVMPAGGKSQHWLRKSTSGSSGEGSAIFYVNTEDPGKILIFLGKQIYLLDTEYPAAVLRVTSTLPHTDEAFETGEIATEALKDEIATVRHVMGTPDFAGNAD